MKARVLLKLLYSIVGTMTNSLFKLPHLVMNGQDDNLAQLISSEEE